MSGNQLGRRPFIGSLAASVLALRHGSAFAAGGPPLIRFGVLSDVHIGTTPTTENNYRYGHTATFRAALEAFRAWGADAVIVAGDIADRGMPHQLAAAVNVWREVFPDGKAPDGRPVEPVFIYGNHDACPGWFNNCVVKRAKTPEKGEQLRRASISANPAKVWEEVTGEKFSDIYIKKIKGFSFIGCHWYRQRKGRLKAFLEAHKNELSDGKPFFYVQHDHPKGTCHSDWVHGKDDGSSTAALSAFPGAVAFSGHSHHSLTDPRVIWQGAFTSIGTSSLSYVDTPEGCLNTSKAAPWSDEAVKLNKPVGRAARQGWFVTVFADRIELEPYEFVKGEPLAAKTVLPWPARPGRPFCPESGAVPPCFPAGTALAVERTAQGDLRVSFPSAEAAEASRCYQYELTVMGADGQRVAARYCSENFYQARARVPAQQSCVLRGAELPPKIRRVEVVPVGFCGLRGAPLTGEPSV